MFASESGIEPSKITFERESEKLVLIDATYASKVL